MNHDLHIEQINAYISLVSTSLKNIMEYSSILIYKIEGSNLLLHIYCAFLSANYTIKEAVEACEGSIQLFINCLYILDNIQPDEVNSYIDIIKELLYSKSIGHIPITKQKNNAIFHTLKNLTSLILFNESTESNKDMFLLGKIFFIFFELGETQFLYDKMQKLIESKELFQKKFELFCISSVISLQLIN